MVGAEQPWHDHGDELLRAIAHQIAVALEKTELIESLSRRASPGSCSRRCARTRGGRARPGAQAGADLEPPARRRRGAAVRLPRSLPGPTAVERALRQAVPGTICDADGRRVRALVPGADARALAGALGVVARGYGVALGGARRGPARRHPWGAGRGGRCRVVARASARGRRRPALRGDGRLSLSRRAAARRWPPGSAARGGRPPRGVRPRAWSPAAADARALPGERAEPDDLGARADRARQHASPAARPHRVPDRARSRGRGSARASARDQARAAQSRPAPGR